MKGGYKILTNSFGRNLKNFRTFLGRLYEGEGAKLEREGVRRNHVHEDGREAAVREHAQHQ